MTLTPELCRAARGLLGWPQQELARRAEVARKTIADFELGVIKPQARTIRDIIAAIDTGGVEMLPPQENVSRGGVRLKWPAELAAVVLLADCLLGKTLSALAASSFI